MHTTLAANTDTHIIGAAKVESSDQPTVGLFSFNKAESSENCILTIPVKDEAGIESVAEAINEHLDITRIDFEQKPPTSWQLGRQIGALVGEMRKQYELELNATRARFMQDMPEAEAIAAFNVFLCSEAIGNSSTSTSDISRLIEKEKREVALDLLRWGAMNAQYAISQLTKTEA